MDRRALHPERDETRRERRRVAVREGVDDHVIADHSHRARSGNERDTGLPGPMHGVLGVQGRQCRAELLALFVLGPGDGGATLDEDQ